MSAAIFVGLYGLASYVVGVLVGRKLTRPAHNTINISGTPPSREMVKQIAAELRKVVIETHGKDGRASDGWDLL